MVVMAEEFLGKTHSEGNSHMPK